jgi:hypothetical protein
VITVKTRAKKDARNTSDAKKNAKNTSETLTSQGCDSRFMRSVRQRFAKRGPRSDSEECANFFPPAARLVGIELNPGPGSVQKGVKRPKKAAVAKKKRSQRVRRNNVGAGGGALQNRAGSTGRIGLGSTNSGGTTRRAQIIEEDEYIAEVNGSVNFATTSYAINPGQSATFPWAYKIASLYERYFFERLEFYYRREVSEYATNGQTGKVMLSIDYDASDAAPTTKQQVEDTIPHIDGMPCMEQILLRADPKELLGLPSGRYVRPGAQPVNTDIKTYDAGNLYVSTYGCANTNVIGELRVRYRCRLCVPVLESPAASPGQPAGTFQVFSAAGGDTVASTATYQAAFITGTPITQQNGIGATIATTGVVTVPAGRYLVNCSVLASDTTASVTSGNLYLSASNSSTKLLTAVVAMSVSGAYPTYTSAYGSVQTIWETADYGTTICPWFEVAFASGTCLARCVLTIMYMSTTIAVSLSEQHNAKHLVYEDRIQKLERVIARLNPTPLDSDFDEEPSNLSPPSLATSYSKDQLSRSTVDLVTAIVRAKQSMPSSSSISSK